MAFDEAVPERLHARVMDFTGRVMSGFVFVDPTGFADDRTLREWLDLCEKLTDSPAER